MIVGPYASLRSAGRDRLGSPSPTNRLLAITMASMPAVTTPARQAGTARPAAATNRRIRAPPRATHMPPERKPRRALGSRPGPVGVELTIGVRYTDARGDRDHSHAVPAIQRLAHEPTETHKTVREAATGARSEAEAGTDQPVNTLTSAERQRDVDGNWAWLTKTT